MPFKFIDILVFLLFTLTLCSLLVSPVKAQGYYNSTQEINNQQHQQEMLRQQQQILQQQYIQTQQLDQIRRDAEHRFDYNSTRHTNKFDPYSNTFK